MKKLTGSIIYVLGMLLNVLIGSLALLYLFGTVIWMHVPLFKALLVAVALASPFLVLSWVLRKIGRSMNPKFKPLPWYRLDKSGKMVGYTDKTN